MIAPRIATSARGVSEPSLAEFVRDDGFGASLSRSIQLKGHEIPNAMAKDRIRLDELDQSKSLDQDQYKKLLKKYNWSFSMLSLFSERARSR